jgi:hypothetical protein
MVALGDPPGTGLVDSLARPGSNITGMSLMMSLLAAKRLQILKEVIPDLISLSWRSVISRSSSGIGSLPGFVMHRYGRGTKPAGSLLGEATVYQTPKVGI